VHGRALLALALVAALLIALAVPRLVSGLLIVDQEPVLRFIQRGWPIADERLIDARRAYEAAIAWHGGAAERTALASIRLRLALAVGVGTPGGRAVLESAREALRAALAGTPSDPYLWAQLAEAELILGGPETPPFSTALMRSIATGPFEPSLVSVRVAMGLGAWAALDEGARAGIAEQVRIAAVLRPDWLRRAVTDPLRERLVEDILEGRPELFARFRGQALP
jgi:hypothetical protein